MIKPKIVIKLGGSALQNPETLLQLATLVKGYQKRRYDVVLVHGGGPAINEELLSRGIKWQFIDGQRQTTLEMMGAIEKVLAGDINSLLVDHLKQNKISAIGLSGAKDKILFCSQASPQLQQVGKIEFVDTTAIEACFAKFGAFVPVIAPIGLDKNGGKYNINADWAATQIAIAIQAKKLVFLTDQNGILDEKKQLVPKVSSDWINQRIEDGIIYGGMSTKVKAMMKAVQSGIKYVRVMHASSASLLLLDDKVGTLLTAARAKASRSMRSDSEAVHGKAC